MRHGSPGVGQRKATGPGIQEPLPTGKGKENCLPWSLHKATGWCPLAFIQVRAARHFSPTEWLLSLPAGYAELNDKETPPAEPLRVLRGEVGAALCSGEPAAT